MDEVKKWVLDVDYFKSVDKGKLVYKKTVSFIILDYLMVRGFPILVLSAMLYAAFQAWLIEGNYIMLPLSILATIGLISSLFYINTFIEVKGQGIVRNKEDVMNTLKHFYDDLTFEASKENMIRDIKLTKWNSPGHVITVLFKDNNVYFHKSTLMRGSVISPISGLTNIMKCREIAEYFKDLQTNNCR